MKTYFQGHPIATLPLAVTLAIFSINEFRQAIKRRPEARERDRGSRLVLVLFCGGALVLAALARTRVTAAGFHGVAAALGVGLGFAWAGIGLRWWSFKTLGQYFTFVLMTSADQPVVTAGPYRFVRHPSYTGLILIFAGIGVMYENWLSLAALTLLPLFGFMYRIHVEEAALSATLGEAYRSYAESRKRIVPLVW